MSLNAVADCRTMTEAIAGMEQATLGLSAPGHTPQKLAVRVADESSERAAGFQYVCPDTIERTAILFRFERVRRPSFHMRNVKAPLDIAFFDRDGLIVNIQTMKPYVLGAAQYPTYSPPSAVAGALETRAGWFAERGIDAGDWRLALRP